MSKLNMTRMCQTPPPMLPPLSSLGDRTPPSRSNGCVHVCNVAVDGSASDTEIEARTPDCDWVDLGHSHDRCSGSEEYGSIDPESDTSHKLRESTTRHTSLAAVPDRGGVRFCRVCEGFLPIAAFPRGQRRYACRAHLWERTGRRAKKTLLMQPRKKLLTRMWTQCYKDRAAFGQARVELTQADIGALLDQLPCADADQRPSVGSTGLSVVPEDPSRPLSKHNARLVAREARRELLGLARG